MESGGAATGSNKGINNEVPNMVETPSEFSAQLVTSLFVPHAVPTRAYIGSL